MVRTSLTASPFSLVTTFKQMFLAFSYIISRCPLSPFPRNLQDSKQVDHVNLLWLYKYSFRFDYLNNNQNSAQVRLGRLQNLLSSSCVEHLGRPQEIFVLYQVGYHVPYLYFINENSVVRYEKLIKKDNTRKQAKKQHAI